MSSPQSKRTHLRGFSLATSAGLLAGLLATGQAAAQATGPANAGASQPTQDEGTKREPVAHDPFSPFVYDVLGATPSIRLPAFFGKQTRAAADANEPSSADRIAKDGAAKPTVAAAAGRTDTAARLP